MDPEDPPAARVRSSALSLPIGEPQESIAMSRNRLPTADTDKRPADRAARHRFVLRRRWLASAACSGCRAFGGRGHEPTRRSALSDPARTRYGFAARRSARACSRSAIAPRRSSGSPSPATAKHRRADVRDRVRTATWWPSWTGTAATSARCRRHSPAATPAGYVDCTGAVCRSPCTARSCGANSTCAWCCTAPHPAIGLSAGTRPLGECRDRRIPLPPKPPADRG